jgi:hypothetical protein
VQKNKTPEQRELNEILLFFLIKKISKNSSFSSLGL